MNPTLLKIIGGALIFSGEALAIYQEMIAARAAKEQGLTLAAGAWMLG